MRQGVAYIPSVLINHDDVKEPAMGQALCGFASALSAAGSGARAWRAGGMKYQGMVYKIIFTSWRGIFCYNHFPAINNGGL